MKKITFVGALVALAASLVMNAGQALAAGTGTLTLSAAGATTINNTLAITIYESSQAQAVNVVTAKLAYDVSKLQFVSIDATGSAFDADWVQSGGNGSVTVTRGVFGGTVSGDQKKVATVNFKALAGSGSTAVTFADGSKIMRPDNADGTSNTNIWNGETTGGTYSFATPAGGSGGGSTGVLSGNTSSNTGSSQTSSGNQSASSPARNDYVAAAQDASTTPQPTPPTTGEVKTDDAAKDETKKEDDKKDAANKDQGSIWPWVLLAAIVAFIISYYRRKRLAATRAAAPAAGRPGTRSTGETAATETTPATQRAKAKKNKNSRS